MKKGVPGTPPREVCTVCCAPPPGRPRVPTRVPQSCRSRDINNLFISHYSFNYDFPFIVMFQAQLASYVECCTCDEWRQWRENLVTCSDRSVLITVEVWDPKCPNSRGVLANLNFAFIKSVRFSPPLKFCNWSKTLSPTSQRESSNAITFFTNSWSR